MGRWIPRTGIKDMPMLFKDAAMKSQYLKKKSRARFMMTEEATAPFAREILPAFFQRSTRMPWVKSMAVDQSMIRK